MRIVLNTRFNNPLLPRVQMPGFFDDFDRPVGANLGVTSGEGREWKYASNGTAPLWRPSSGGTAVLISGATRNVAYLDGLTTNGTLSVTAASLGSNRQGGLIGRYQDIDNNLFAFQPDNVSGLALYRRVAGVATRIGETTYIPSNTDVYAWEFNDENLIFSVNGAVKITATETAFLGETGFGLLGTSSALQMGWDNIRLVAA